mgnify:CR=1 FL=1
MKIEFTKMGATGICRMCNKRISKGDEVIRIAIAHSGGGGTANYCKKEFRKIWDQFEAINCKLIERFIIENSEREINDTLS